QSRIRGQLTAGNRREHARRFDAYCSQRIAKRGRGQLHPEVQRGAEQRLKRAKPDDAAGIAKVVSERLDGRGIRRDLELRERGRAGNRWLRGVVRDGTELRLAIARAGVCE